MEVAPSGCPQDPTQPRAEQRRRASRLRDLARAKRRPRRCAKPALERAFLRRIFGRLRHAGHLADALPKSAGQGLRRAGTALPDVLQPDGNRPRLYAVPAPCRRRRHHLARLVGDEPAGRQGLAIQPNRPHDCAVAHGHDAHHRRMGRHWSRRSGYREPDRGRACIRSAADHWRADRIPTLLRRRKPEHEHRPARHALRRQLRRRHLARIARRSSAPLRIGHECQRLEEHRCADSQRQRDRRALVYCGLAVAAAGQRRVCLRTDSARFRRLAAVPQVRIFPALVAV